MTGKRQRPRGGKPNPLADRYTYITSVKAGNRTIAWLAIDRKSKRVVVAAPVGKARLLSLKQVRGLAPGHLAPIIRLLRTPESSQLPADLGSSRPVGIAIADYVPGDTLHARLKFGQLPALDAVNLCAQVVRAVRAMHDAGTPHGAISPRAIVTSPKGQWSGPVVTQLIAPTSGAFSSRERLQKRGPSFEDDSWAAHATLHAALTAEGPFAGKTREELLQNMFGSKPRRLDQFGVDEPELQKIIDAGLVTNPRYRASLEKLERSLEQWLEKQGRRVQSLAPPSGDNAMFPKDDANAIVLSEPPPVSEGSSPLLLPRPHGKSLVGIVIDEPIDADAPAFTPPERPEDLLDAVDDDGEAEDDATMIYRPESGESLPATALASAATAGGQSQSAPSRPEPTNPRPSERASAGEAQPASPELAGARSYKKASSASGSGQALAAALALAVAAAVTLFVRHRSESERGDEQLAGQTSSTAELSSVASERAECVAAFFPNGSVGINEDFDFLCRAVDLRSTTKRLEERVSARHGTEGSNAWASLGWYELPLTATIRHRCCDAQMAERILLPQPPPNCQSLALVLQEMTMPPLSRENVTERSAAFERAVECLTEEKQASAYGQEGASSPQNRQAFEAFVEREARSRTN